MDWNAFYFDALQRGMTKEDAEWHADMMMDQLNRPLDFTGYKEKDNDALYEGR